MGSDQEEGAVGNFSDDDADHEKSMADPTFFQKETKVEMLYEHIHDTVFKHEAEKIRLKENLKTNLFQKMKFYQDCGFNIMMHGVGSKRDILNTYLNEKLILNGHDVTVVNGFHSGTGMKNLLTSCFKFLNMTNPGLKKPVSLSEQFE